MNAGVKPGTVSVSTWKFWGVKVRNVDVFLAPDGGARARKHQIHATVHSQYPWHKLGKRHKKRIPSPAILKHAEKRLNGEHN